MGVVGRGFSLCGKRVFAPLDFSRRHVFDLDHAVIGLVPRTPGVFLGGEVMEGAYGGRANA